ncbi:MAG: DUF885 domain-containing protein [Rhizobiaceae bacterium]|nr:DUF885 domain-containing protein [Rhizobiaceae bacterium]
MTSAYDPVLVDTFLKHHWTYHPVDATFMGDLEHDGRLPPVSAETLDEELVANAALKAQIEATAEPEGLGERLDRRLMLSELAIQAATARLRPRFHNPAWFSGEAAFSIISLLLPQSAPVREDALLKRLNGVESFLAEGLQRLAGAEVPRSWVARAIRECRAVATFLRTDIRLHDTFSEAWISPAETAALAFETFAAGLDGLVDADPACGEAYIAQLMATVHGLSLTPREAVAQAEKAFDDLGLELESMARSIDPEKSWQEIIASLSGIHPDNPEGVIASYGGWDRLARDESTGLVSAAEEYGLDYRWMAPCFRNVAKSLYFLFYRSPPGLNARDGSVYWVTPPGDDADAFLQANSTAMVKTIHSVHHGGVGHHTQNARARQSTSRLARIAGTDCSLGLAFLGSGTLIEGWACYVEDLLMEVPGFYTPAEILLLKQFERRNAASVLVDIKLHLGEWSLEEAMAFYRDKAGFAPARVEGEVVRNSMLPGSRLMYWLGVEGIKSLRRRWKGDTLSFHDTLLSFGHMPLAWIGEEMQRAGQLHG